MKTEKLIDILQWQIHSTTSDVVISKPIAQELVRHLQAQQKITAEAKDWGVMTDDQTLEFVQDIADGAFHVQ